MDWKKKILLTFNNLKGKKNLCIWIAGFVFLSLVLPYALLVNHDSSRKLNALLEELETLKSFMSEQNFESVLKRDMQFSDKEGTSRIRNRKKRDVGKFKDAENNCNPSLQGTGGAVYIRWGRTKCPENYTELVYNGIAGGSLYDHTGAASSYIIAQFKQLQEVQFTSDGDDCSTICFSLLSVGIAGGSWFHHTGAATNHQCLPNKPDWGRFTDGGGHAHMYGMEYDESMSGIMDTSNVQKGILNHNVPCAVCRSSIRTSSLMIPVKNKCYEGWHLEYTGYLMAGHHGHTAGTQYICVDEAPEADPAGYRNEEGTLLYRVTAQCGSLPCPRYVQNRELTCVVCTR